MEAHFNRVALIGLGLIGGSIALGLKQSGRASVITAFDHNPASLQHGLRAGIIDSAADSAQQACAGAELIVLAVPVLAMHSVFREIAFALDDPAIVITDVGSVKGIVVAAATAVLGKVPANLVPGHPIAGSERHGVEAADANLFLGHKVILTPGPATQPGATQKVREMWQALSAEVVEMDAAHHDAILAQTSHLPHLLAFALVDTLSQQGDSLELFEYAAGGFRDFTRIAASDPIMWRDIFATNPGPVLEILDRYVDDLGRLRELIKTGRLAELADVFTRSKAARDHFSRLLAQREGKGAP